MKKQNEIHCFEFDEDTNKIVNARVYAHSGEVNKLFPNPTNENLFFASVSNCSFIILKSVKKIGSYISIYLLIYQIK